MFYLFYLSQPPCGVGSSSVLSILTDRELEAGRLSNLTKGSLSLKQNCKLHLSDSNALALWPPHVIVH